MPSPPAGKREVAVQSLGFLTAKLENLPPHQEPSVRLDRKPPTACLGAVLLFVHRPLNLTLCLALQQEL